MKSVIARVLICMFLTVFMVTAAYAQGTTTDIRQFNWGDSQEYVESVEGEPVYEGQMNGLNANYIAYETTAVGLDMLIAYYFCDDGLFQARYILTEPHSNETLYIDDYSTFRSALTKKYGDPLWDYESWENDSKKEYYANRKGDALCYGYLSYMTWYFTDRTTIYMNMSADNYDISMTVDYESNEISAGEADFSGDI